jgi:tripartite-type tricarboxylate transporter receptor subunit TctC
VLAKLEGALRTVMADAGVRKKLEDTEVQPVFMSAAETRKWLDDDVRRFSVVIRDAGLAIAK